MFPVAFLSSIPLLRNRCPPISISRTSSARHPPIPLALAPPPTPPKAPPPPTIPPTIPTIIPDTSNPLPIIHETLPQSPLSYLWPRLLLLTVAVIWGTNFPLVKILHTPPDPLPVPTAALARFTLASVAMLPFIPAELKAANRTSFPISFLTSTLFIGAAVSAAYFAQSVALATTDASTSAFICSLSVVIVPILTRFAKAIGWISDVPNRALFATWGAPFLAVLGVAMLEFGGTPPSIGDAWAFVQAFGFATGFILNDRLAAKYPDLVFSQSAFQLNIVAALALVWSIVDSSAAAGTLTFPHIADAFNHGTNALALLYTGLITTALTVWLENVALKRVSAGELAVLLSTEPFWAAALAAILLGETMGPWALTGGAVILLACVINQAGGTDCGNSLEDGKQQDVTKQDVETRREALVSMFNKQHRR